MADWHWWRPGNADPFGAAYFSAPSSVPLVRPYVLAVNPEPRPSAPAPALIAAADCCGAAPATVFWSVQIMEAVRIWDLYAPDWTTQVAELQLCGHHADMHEDRADERGWIVVLDTRQRARDLAR